MTIGGEKFMCKKHGLSYRILCEECQDKFKKFNEVSKKIIEENRRVNDKTN